MQWLVENRCEKITIKLNAHQEQGLVRIVLDSPTSIDQTVQQWAEIIFKKDLGMTLQD